jgi:hypothetical protein
MCQTIYATLLGSGRNRAKLKKQLSETLHRSTTWINQAVDTWHLVELYPRFRYVVGWSISFMYENAHTIRMWLNTHRQHQAKWEKVSDIERDGDVAHVES